MKSNVYLRITGAPPVQAAIHFAEQLRCGDCGYIVKADVPDEVKNTPKYDSYAKANMRIFKYELGIAYNHFEAYQKNFGVPLPASTQSDKIKEDDDVIEAIFLELETDAAEGNAVGFDDSKIKVQSFEKANKEGLLEPEERMGYHTTVVFSEHPDGHEIVLFYTGRNHGGENLKDLMNKRPDDLPPPLIMSDALNCYQKYKNDYIDIRCLDHARRKFHDLLEFYKKPCERVIELFGKIYHNDKIAKEKEMTPEERLIYHQKNSAAPLLELTNLTADLLKQEEKNSELYKACYTNSEMYPS